MKYNILILDVEENTEMSSKRKHEVYSYFKYSAEKKTNKCESCDIELNSNHAENLMRHLKVKHRDIYDNLDSKRRKKTENIQPTLNNYVTKCKKMHSVKILPQELQNACVEMVTKNGRPLIAVEDSGFRKIIDPILNSFEEKITINRHNIKDLIKSQADELRNLLKIKLKGKIISIKVDGASRLDRSILGVNVQYVDNGKIKINTLAMLELKDRHTAEYLLDKILYVLNKYGIDVKQIYSFTSDNGANMVKTGELLKNVQFCSSTSSLSNLKGCSDLNNEVDDGSNSDIDTDNEIQEDIDTLHLYDNEFEDLETEITRLNKEFIVSIRCAAHTLQLAIGDFLKKANLQNVITVSVCVVKKLRNPSILTIIKRAGLRKPVLHCPTRWDSTLKMISSLINLKTFCSEYQEAIPELKVSEENWSKMTKLVAVLTPAHEASLNLQNEQLTMSDFFNVLTKCKLAIKKINSSYSNIFGNCLEMRSVNVMNSDTMLACIYLDPRYQILLNIDQKNSAKAHICKIQNYIHDQEYSKQPNSFPSPPLSKEDDQTTNVSDNDENNLDEMDELIFITEKELADVIQAPVPKQNFRTIVDNFDNIQRLNRREDPKKYWQNNEIFGELSEVANILFAVPATQVSVERAFSTLKFILADNRDGLSENVLEDILFIKLN